MALPAAGMRSALTATTASLSRCSVAATAQGVNGGGVTIQAYPISATDMWFAELVGRVLNVAHYNPSGQPSTVLQPFGTAQVIFGYIAAFGDNDIWAVGSNFEQPTALIAHWNGSSWRQVTLSGPDTSLFHPTGLSGLSTNDVWMSGTVQVPGDPAGVGRMALAHWNGSTFSVVGVSPYGNTAGPLLELSPTNIWVTAYNSVDALAVQWNGSHFTFNKLPPPPGQSDAHALLWQIAATGPNNIWIVGTHATATTVVGRIWRYNGNWQPYLYTPASGNDSAFEGVAPLDATRTVITAGEGGQGTTATFGSSGTTRFQPIPNNIPTSVTSPDAVIPGTTNFWMPDESGIYLVSCN